MLNRFKKVRTMKQLQGLPLSVRSSLLEPKWTPSEEAIHYIFRYTVTYDGVDYQLDWTAISKQLAPELQVRGEPGGWIYPLVGGDGQWKNTIQTGKPICQGWIEFAKHKHPRIASAARRMLGDSQY